jgi:uncharacterized protein
MRFLDALGFPALMIGLAVILAACAGQPAPTPTPVAVARATVAPTDTPAPTATSAPTATPTASSTSTAVPTRTSTPTATATPAATPTSTPLSPLAIEFMRNQSYPGSDLVIQETLQPGANYNRYVAAYKSEGLKINGLLTVPTGQKPPGGWPVIIFNHGYIPPDQYRTTERYVAYQDAFARNGYITFKSDYRGHGSSEGRANGGYGNIDYTADVLNALASVKRLKEADPNRIGMWGHSMGGSVTLRAMVTVPDIKAGVIWAGVVASYPDLLDRWRRAPAGPGGMPAPARGWRNDLTAQYGTPEQNPQFYDSISPNSYLKDISGPLQLHHGTADESVPVEFSDTLEKQMKDAGKSVEYFKYPGDNHNISNNLSVALQRSVAFFDKYVKGSVAATPTPGK